MSRLSRRYLFRLCPEAGARGESPFPLSPRLGGGRGDRGEGGRAASRGKALAEWRVLPPHPRPLSPEAGARGERTWSARLVASCLLAFAAVAVAAEKPAAPPAAPVKVVTDEYHGTKVPDPYRWLEDADDASVKKWVAEQKRYARTVLTRAPDRNAILKRLFALNKGEGVDTDRVSIQDGNLFARQDGSLIVQKGITATSARTLVDIETVLPGKRAKVEAYAVSPDGSKVAVAISADGFEEGTVSVYEVATGKKLSDQVPRVFTPYSGSLEWKGDNTGFYYTHHDPRREPRPHDRYCFQQIYFHQLGTPTAQDAYVLGKGWSRLSSTHLSLSPDGGHLLVSRGAGLDPTEGHAIFGPGDALTPLTKPTDRIVQASWGPGPTLLLLSQDKAPRGRILSLSLIRPQLALARTIVAAGEGVIRRFVNSNERIYVSERRDDVERLRVFEATGRELKEVPLPPRSTVAELAEVPGDTLLLRTETYLAAPEWWQYDLATGKKTATKLSTPSPVKFDDIEILREYPKSKDGTRIPMTILCRKGTKLDGSNPVLLTGYGGFGEFQLPNFDVDRRLWFDHGGVYAVAHLRGDGDGGAGWYDAGRLLNKQNTFDDFAACARHLIDRKYTTAKRMAAMGGSNGGLLMGAAITQYPELFAAVVSDCGIYDKVRDEVIRGGANSVTEYGTVADREQFRAMFAYSPYHRIKDGTAYPAVLLRHGANDGRVDPAHSRKFAARLQAATSSQRPVLLWISERAGHAVSSPGQGLDREADLYAFLFQHLGMKFQK